VLWTVVSLGLIVSALGLLQYNGIHLIPLPEAYGNLPVSTLGNPSFVAHYLEIVVILNIGLLAVRRRLWERMLLGLALLMTGSLMVLTHSRGGWLATAVGLLVLFLLLKRRGRWGSFLILIAVVVALLIPVMELGLSHVYVGEGESLYESLGQVAGRATDRALSSFEMGNFSISQRRIIWLDTLELIADHLWLGVGPGQYELFVPAYRSQGRHEEWEALMGERTNVPYRAHNEYLEVLAESGVFGLAAFLWLLGAVLWSGYGRLQRQTDRTVRVITGSCLAGMAATLVHAFFSFNLQDPTSAIHFWLLAGLAIAVNQGGGEECRKGFPIDLYLGRNLRMAIATGAALAVLAGGYAGLCILVGDYYYFLGLEKNEIGQPNRAMLAFQKAIPWRAHDFRYYHMLGLVHLKAGRYTEAAQALRRGMELHPNNPTASMLLGRALYQLGEEDEAIAALRKAVRLAPRENENYELLALIYRGQGRHSRAVDTWRAALSLKPEDAVLLHGLGVEHAWAGELEQAASALERALRLHPRDANIQGDLGSIYLSMGREEQARLLLLQASEQKPEQVEWRLALAQLYMRQGELDLAREQVQAVLALQPDNRPALHLARALHSRQQKGER
jgi:Flp pilus assembly protein TadD/O-antigen ligase